MEVFVGSPTQEVGMEVFFGSPTQEVGSIIHTKKKVVQPYDDPVKAPSPSQEIPTKPPDPQPEIKRKRKKTKKNRKKRMKRRTPKGIIDPSTNPEINLAHSHIHKKCDQKLHKRRQNKRTSGLITDPPTVPGSWKVSKKVFMGLVIIACMDQTHCLYRRSVEEGPTAIPEDEPHNENTKVYKRSMEETVTSEPHKKKKTDTFICTDSVHVSDFPVIIHLGEQNFTFTEPIDCPNKVSIFPSCFACFENKSEIFLKIFSQILGNVDIQEIRIEHGKGIGKTNLVEMDGSNCSVEDGPTPTPNYEPHNENKKGASWCLIVLGIVLVISLGIFLKSVIKSECDRWTQLQAQIRGPPPTPPMIVYWRQLYC